MSADVRSAGIVPEGGRGWARGKAFLTASRASALRSAAVGVVDRARMLLDRGVTLGTLLERAATVHGDRQLVDESDDGLALTFQDGADRVARWAGSIQRRISPGD